MNGSAITKDTFERMDSNSKLSVLFDLSQDTHKQLTALTKRKRVDKALSVTGGIIGGFAAMIGKSLLWR